MLHQIVTIDIFPLVFLALYFFSALVLTSYYTGLMWKYHRYWKALPPWSVPDSFIPQTKVSILVPARNEAANIEACIQSIFAQKYPRHLFELIIIDDHSTDATPRLVRIMKKKYPQLSLICLADLQVDQDHIAFKKWALEQGIAKAKGDLIVGTDADCMVSENWLNLLVSFYESKKYAFIAAPVNFFQEQNQLEYFQSLDFIGMMGITGAGIHGKFQHMCNGANLAYERSAFEAVGGFKGIDGRASGDDMLLLQKMAKQFPERIGFLKNPAATVHTKAMPDWRSFLNQRIRWASKSYDYPEWQVTFRLAMVFLFCCFILFSPLLIPFLGWYAAIIFVGMLLVKGIVDYFFLGAMSRFFGRSALMKKYWSAVPLHLIYIVSVGILANITKTYEWKGRKVR